MISEKKARKNQNRNFLVFFPTGKKGMEMWQIILLILAITLLLFMLVWYGGLRNELAGLFQKIGEQL